MRLFRVLRSIGNATGSGALNTAAQAGGRVAQETSPSVIRKLFGKYLLLTNTLSAGLLMVAGDLVAQEIEFRAKDKKKGSANVHQIDWTRVGE